MGRIIIQHNDHELISALEDEGYNVLSVLTPEVIVSGAEYFNPHVVVLDFDKEDSISTCMEVKSRFPHIAVIALSCDHLIAEHQSDYGFNGYIAQPLTVSRLLPLLELFAVRNLAEAS